MVTQMIEVGEESGQISQMLDKIADFYDREVDIGRRVPDRVDRTDHGARSWASIVGGMVICLYLPMFTIYQNIQGAQ